MVILSFSCGYTHTHTHARSPVLVETHAGSLDVLRWSESRWETHFEHICVYNLSFGLCMETQPYSSLVLTWNRETHARSYAFGPNQQETPTRSQYVPCIFLCRVCLCSCPSVPNCRREKNTRFVILQRWSHRANIWCSCHVSGPGVLPWSIKLAKP